VYATSKLLGEWFAADAPRAYVLRVESLFGRAPGAGPEKGSVAGIVNTLKAGGSPKVFEDRTISPTYVIDAARATRRLLESAAPAGLYHCVNSGRCTWLEFAQELVRQLHIEPRLVPVRMADMVLRAPRPQYCALSNEKLRSVGVEMPSWQDALKRFAATSP
jgi:dTDP-4-dehydrorhamnose reductase